MIIWSQSENLTSTGHAKNSLGAEKPIFLTFQQHFSQGRTPLISLKFLSDKVLLDITFI